jgi:hypothetical protein
MTDLERTQSILVYTGPGSSNSWIWLADFLEERGFIGTRFCPDPGDILSASNRCVLIVPGGDTFRIAEAFGERGLAELGESISSGMNYIGICAGAYLPLRSTIAPLSSFNLLSARISNISSELPAGMAEPGRYSVRYGCSYVFHPARGPVQLSGDAKIIAPIYGGPFLAPSNGDRTRLVFSGTTCDTELLVDRRYYEKLSAGRAACVEGTYGKGRVIAIAPHLEHPDYPEANDYFGEMLRGFDASAHAAQIAPGPTLDLRELRSVIADLRLLLNALDTRHWTVGIKSWEGEKLLLFVDAIRRRIATLRGRDGDGFPLPAVALSSFVKAREILRGGRELEAADIDLLARALSDGASHFLNAHFSERSE